MLVKLGNIWADPTKITALGPDDDTGKLVIVIEGRNHTPENISADECAAIINTAGQSFGGDDNEKPKEE